MLAAEMGTRQSDLLAQRVDQTLTRLDEERGGLAVESERYPVHCHWDALEALDSANSSERWTRTGAILRR